MQGSTTHTILIVEDNEPMAEGLRRMLEGEGFHAEVASDGLEALAWLAERIPDLIVADIMMPNLDGYQLYLRLQQHPEWVQIPFIFLTARGDAKDIHFGKELGVDDYLAKPFEPEDLIVAVRGRLRRFDQLRAASSLPSHQNPAHYHQVGKLLIDFSQRQITQGEREVALTPTECDILRRLALADGAVLSHQELLGDAEKQSIGPQEARQRVRTYVHRLRGKFRAAGEDDELIVAVRGSGYRLATTQPGLSQPDGAQALNRVDTAGR